MRSSSCRKPLYKTHLFKDDEEIFLHSYSDKDNNPITIKQFEEIKKYNIYIS